MPGERVGERGTPSAVIDFSVVVIATAAVALCTPALARILSCRATDERA